MALLRSNGKTRNQLYVGKFMKITDFDAFSPPNGPLFWAL